MTPCIASTIWTPATAHQSFVCCDANMRAGFVRILKSTGRRCGEASGVAPGSACGIGGRLGLERRRPVTSIVGAISRSGGGSIARRTRSTTLWKRSPAPKRVRPDRAGDDDDDERDHEEGDEERRPAARAWWRIPQWISRPVRHSLMGRVDDDTSVVVHRRDGIAAMRGDAVSSRPASAALTVSPAEPVPWRGADGRRGGHAACPDAASRRAILPRGAILLSALTFASYVMGLVRDRTFARTFGAGSELDVYNAALVLPELALEHPRRRWPRVRVRAGLRAPAQRGRRRHRRTSRARS